MSKNLLPKHAFFISGTGRHPDRLQAFDEALLSAGPLAHNLVSVSSILPAQCKIITPEEGFAMLTPGEITFCVMAKQETNQPTEVASAAIGIAKIKDPQSFGYLSEYHGNAQGESEAGEIAKRLAIEMFARKLKIPCENLDLDINHAQAASIKQSGNEEWVCAVALCVFVI